MAEHAALGVTCCSTRVDKAAALTWLLFGHLRLNYLVANSLTDLHEVTPQEKARARDSLRQGSFTPDNKCFHLVVLVEIDRESLQVFRSFDHDHLSLCMRGLVEACVCLIGDINTSVDLVVENAADEGDGPLWRVESHNGYSRAVCAAQRVAGFREAERVVIVLIPGPALLYLLSFDPHSWSVSTTLDSTREHLAKSKRNL